MISIVLSTISKEFAYLWKEITFQTIGLNWFWMLTGVSLTIALAEKILPWRKEQPVVRKEFWLEVIYMYFNYFLFKILFLSWIGFFSKQAIMEVINQPLSNFALIDLSVLPAPVAFLFFFVMLDLVQFGVHVALHHVPILWEFHKVHHSVEEMSFPAHLRYHWMENILYTPAKYLLVTLLFGFAPSTAMYGYVAATIIGHLNHANLNITYGPLKYILNNPRMHIWHHAKELPYERRYGADFGISLSIWDYLFKTAWIPENGRDIKLGYKGMKDMPSNLFAQLLFPLTKRKTS